MSICNTCSSLDTVGRRLDVVRLAEHDLSTDQETTHLDLRVDKIILHENFRLPRMYDDIALVKCVWNQISAGLIGGYKMIHIFSLMEKS